MRVLRYAAVLAFGVAMCATAQAAEHVTLRNGFALDCARQEVSGDRVRLYLLSSSAGGEGNYIEVPSAQIVSAETIADPPVVPAAKGSEGAVTSRPELAPNAREMQQMVATAGTRHNIDADLLASVIQAESGGQVRAVSRAGARGLMQLMPRTAADLGVADSFAPAENIGGGTAYLDELLTRYHDDLALALAAYNAGPAAVDRYHGVPPFAETRAYVARIIREFNRRKRASLAAVASVQLAR